MKLSIGDTVSFLIASRVPNLSIIAIAQFVAAYCLLQIPLDRLIDIKFGLFILSTGMIGAGGYIINDYFDQKIDMINRPQHVIVGTNLKRRFALLFHTLLTIGGIILGFALDPFIGAIHIFSSGALWMYSGILKRQLLIGTLTISFLTSLSLLILMVYFRKFSTLVIAYSMFGCVTIFIRESIKDIISVKGEIAFNVHSVPILWGIRGAKVVILLAGLAGICMITFYLLSISNWTIRYFFMAIFLVVLWAFYRLIKADRMKDFEEIKKVIDMIITLGLMSIAIA